MGEYADRDRFIPLRTAEIVELLCEEGTLTATQRNRFNSLAVLIEDIFHHEFQADTEALEEYYYPFDPDTDLITLQEHSRKERRMMKGQFFKRIYRLFKKANFDRVDQEEIDYAMEEDSDMAVKVNLDFDDFEEMQLFKRGETTQVVEVPGPLRHLSSTLGDRFKRKIEIEIYKRVVTILRFKPDYRGSRKTLQMESDETKIYIKVFKNVPKKDLEMIFPNSKVKMTIFDRLKIIVPVLLGLGAGATNIYKLVQGETTDELLVVFAVALLGYVVKSYISYKNAILTYIKTLSSGLYFRNIANGLSTIHYLANEAEEEETKEAMLAYYFLLKHDAPVKQAALDDTVEEWFEEKGIVIDWEVDDALSKLKRLGLASTSDGGWTVVPLDTALDRLLTHWTEMERDAVSG